MKNPASNDELVEMVEVLDDRVGELDRRIERLRKSVNLLIRTLIPVEDEDDVS